MTDNLRRRAIFAPHAFYPDGAHGAGPEGITNLVYKATKATTEDKAWIEEATAQIGEWRSLSRSVYLRWAITIHACELAENRYRGMTKTALTTKAMRVVNGMPEPVTLALWPGPEAAANYETTKFLIAAYGVIDLYGAIEDILFEFAEIVYRHHPRDLMQGSEPQMRALRKLWHHRNDSEDAAASWKAAWLERFDAWQRRAVFEGGTPGLLRNLFRVAGLRRPTYSQHTDIDSWASTLKMIAVLRNHIVHGAPTVSAELAALSSQKANLTFDFIEGAPLDVKLHHLQSVELFIDQLLGAMNVSMIEKAMGPMSAAAAPPPTATP